MRKSAHISNSWNIFCISPSHVLKTRSTHFIQNKYCKTVFSISLKLYNYLATIQQWPEYQLTIIITSHILTFPLFQVLKLKRWSKKLVWSDAYYGVSTQDPLVLREKPTLQLCLFGHTKTFLYWSTCECHGSRESWTCALWCILKEIPFHAQTCL